MIERPIPVAPSARLNQGLFLQSLVLTTLTVIHSMRYRGLARTLLFLGLGLGLSACGEYNAINRLRLLTHHTYPQMRRVPVGTVLGWYSIAYAIFSVWESLIFARGRASARRWLLPPATALTATNLDLLMDCFGLDSGFWEWTEGGPYACDLVGANGRVGIPIGNFVGWIILTALVPFLYLLLSQEHTKDDTPSGAAGSAQAGRTAALLLLPYYLGSCAWAIYRRKWRYLAYAGLTPLVLALALLHSTPTHPAK